MVTEIIVQLFDKSEKTFFPFSEFVERIDDILVFSTYVC